MTQIENNAQERLGTQPVGRLLLSLALPAITAQVINALYNIVDRIYIGRLESGGTYALAALGVTFPLIMIISAFAAFVGMGGAPRAAIKMGEGDYDSAENILGNCVTMTVIISALLMTAFFFTKETLLTWFGATENTLATANDYFTIYLFGTLFVQIPLSLNPFINTQGFAKTGMLTVLIGAVTNIALDPILIFGLNMGVKGAAIATVISQFVSAVWVMSFFIGKKSTLRLRKKNFRLKASIVLPTMALGIAPFIMQATESLVQITLNSGMKQYGGAMADSYISVIAIAVSCNQLVMMPLVGLGQGAQPIMSYNYGAGRYDRVKKTVKLLMTVSITLSTLFWAVAMIVPQVFVYMFSDDRGLINLGVFGVRIFMAGVFASGAQLACQNTFVALGQAKTSLFIALLRKIILLIPLAMILPIFWGTTGIFVAEPVADILAATITVIVCIVQTKRLLKQEQ